MKRLLPLLIVTALVGCKTPTQPPTAVSGPPSPPGMASVRAPRLVDVVAYKQPIPQEFVPQVNNLYISRTPTNNVLWWLTNGLKSFILSSTNIATPLDQWEVLSTLYATESNGVVSLPITNTISRFRCYRLLSVPSNVIAFSWKYHFSSNKEVAGFNLYEGNTNNVYNFTNPMPGKRLWYVWPVTNFDRRYYVVTPFDTNGVEGKFSNEVNYAPADPPTDYPFPAP